MHTVNVDKELSKYKQKWLVSGEDSGEPYGADGIGLFVPQR